MRKHGIGGVLACALAAALPGCSEGVPTAPQSAAPAERASTATAPRGVGVVQAVDPSAGTVTIAHQPIESIGWPAMTMSFKVAKPELLQVVSVGEKVEFALDGTEMSASITSLTEAR